MARKVTVKLDTDRELKYRWPDLSALTRMCGAPLRGERSILSSLAAYDADTFTACLLVGLRHDERKLDVDRVNVLIQAYLEADGTLDGLGLTIIDAFKAARFLKDDIPAAVPDPQ